MSDDLFMSTEMNDTEIACAVIAFVAGEATVEQQFRLSQPENVVRALTYSLNMFQVTALALQDALPDVALKTNLYSVAMGVVDAFEDMDKT